MKRIWILTVMVLAAGSAVSADERIASEDFSSSETLSFGPESVIRGRLRSEASAEYPFDRLVELPADSELTSTALDPGPTAQGSLEDVVWMKLTSFDENEPGRRAGFLAVTFDKGGPDVRVMRISTRPEATVEWFDGTTWERTGAAFPLDRSYRLRTVMSLETGTMDLFLKEEPGGKEVSLVLGATFRAFSSGEVKRKFAVGRPTEMKVGLSAWQLWRVGQSELLRQVPPGSEGRPKASVTVMRYAAPVTLEGDAVSVESAAGTIICTLKPVRGLRDDMELTDISAWSLPERVQRQMSFRHSGKWSLAISEGSEPVDREVTLPRTDFDLRLFFLVPKDLPANRQIYLVRFKNTETGAEPVGPSVYLDYGARPDGKSLVICQLRPEQYYSHEVEVKPAVWYGLHLVSRQALNAYTAGFVDEKGVEQPINDGKPLDFFLGTGLGEHVRWRLFSIVSMRPAVTEWPKLEVVLRRGRVAVTIPANAKPLLTGLTLKGLRAEKAKDLDFARPESVLNTVQRQGEVIQKDWPAFQITPADAAKLKDYKILLIEGNVYLPWPGVEFSYNTSGSMWLWTTSGYVPAVATAIGEYRKWPQSGEKPRPVPEGVAPVRMMFLPGESASYLRAELHWINPSGKVEEHHPIPPALIRGTDVVLDHPGSAQPAQAAAFADGKLYVVVPNTGLAVYNRELVRTQFSPRQLESVAGYSSYPVSGFAWDPWGQCFYLQSSVGRRAAKLDRNLKLMDPASVFYLDAVGLAAGSDALYFVTNAGAVVKSDKFLGLRTGIPVEKMFGGAPLFSAVACADRFLYLATRKDSPLCPSHLICVDLTTWNPVFSVNLEQKFPDVTCMTTDGETMYLFDALGADVATVKLPAKHELAPQRTFVYVDDMELVGIRSAADIQLLPSASRDASGWTPTGGILPNEKGQGWVVIRGGVSAYEKPSIAVAGKESSQYGYLKLRTLDAPGDFGSLNVDVRTAESPLLRRIVILYTRQQNVIQQAPELYGRSYTLSEFLRARGFDSWRSQFADYLRGPVAGRELKIIRMLCAGKGCLEHVFSLEKDLGIKPGETINGVMLSGNSPPPVLLVSLSPSEWTAPEENSGAVTSHPVHLDGTLRKLEYVSWEQLPYDLTKGTMRMCLRTAGEKYFIDRVPWVPVENQKMLGMPLGRYLTWRLEMSTKDPWRPPGVSGLVFGLSGTGAPTEGGEKPGSGRWAWFFLAIPAAAAVAYFLIGRRAWWELRKRPGGSGRIPSPPTGGRGSG